MAVAEIPFDLADAKLAAPSTRAGSVSKADAIATLTSSRSPLVTVIAPAGYGKTTLLAQWSEADPRPFSWVSLDGQDSDAVVFLRYIAAALHSAVPVSPDVFDALSGPGGSTWSKRVPALGRALAAVERPLVLVLDDLHTVVNPSCLDALVALCDYIAAGSRIVIASREELALPVARWRAQGLLDEIGVSDLRLDEREAEALLRAAGTELEASELSDLTERTEGWAAGLYLAALSLQAGAPSSRGATAGGGDGRFVSDYFRDELMARLPPMEARFLEYTSVLDRMRGDTCDYMLQTTGSAQTLQALERANRFVVALDRRSEWYRYHHLFGQLLRDEVERREPDLVRSLNARAMHWCIAHDLPEAAVVYGHVAGETDTVAGLVDSLALPLHYDGRRETVEQWLGWFTDEQLVRYPALAVVGAWFRVLTGRPQDAERWLDLADGAVSAIPLSDGSATIAPWVAVLRAGMMKNGLDQALVDADLALEQLPSTSGWRPAALVLRGTIHALLGAGDRATDDFTVGIKEGFASGAAEPVYVARAQLALLAASHGAWDEAATQAEAAERVVDAAGVGDYGTSALAHVAVARVALHEGRQDDARAALTRAHRLRPMLDYGIPWLTIQVGLELTRAHLVLADASAARTVLTETEQVLALRPDMGVLIEDARELREHVEATSGSAGAWAMSLTGAELRLLPYLATHLMFPEIATRLFISRNTVKTEAVAIYRKLGVSSRSDAIERAVEVGLLDSSVYPPRTNLTPEG